MSDTVNKKVAQSGDSTMKTTKSRKKKKKKRGANIQPDVENDKSSEISRKPKRPNYFIGARFTNPEILGKILAVQEFIKETEPRLTRACVPIKTTHITLAVMHLEDENAVHRACDILQQNSMKLSDALSDIEGDHLNLSVQGIGNFRNDVVFAKLEDDKNIVKLKSTSDILHDIFHEFIGDQRDFKPHLTIMKLSKLNNQRKNKVKKIKPVLYQPFINLNFGKQAIVTYELLSMLKKKNLDGYYFSETAIHIGKSGDIQGNDYNGFEDWAECLAISCITRAITECHSLENVDEYAGKLARNIIENCLKRSSSTKDLDERLKKFKGAINNSETVLRIRKELAVPSDRGVVTP